MRSGHKRDSFIFFFTHLSLFSSQVLYVPRHWWHYVESVDPITVSVNSWIELVRTQFLPEEDERRSATSDMKNIYIFRAWYTAVLQGC